MTDPDGTPAATRLTVALTFDHDSISDGVRRGDPPVKMSHAEFGVRVGAPRILKLLASRGIASTWFVPGHTLETFPDSTAAIIAGGHEIGCHGWFHEDCATLGRDEERELVDRCAAAVEQGAVASTPRTAHRPRITTWWRYIWPPWKGTASVRVGDT